MRRVKDFTQSFTGLIVWPSTIVLFPYVIAKLAQTVGVWQGVNGLYAVSLWLFWPLYVVSHWLYAVLCVGLGYLFATQGEKYGFFWFKHDSHDYYSSRNEPQGKDRSWVVVAVTVVAAAAVVFPEFWISLSTGILAPFLGH